MIPFKAVAVDMDGTFLKDDKSYDYDRFAKLLRKMKANDIYFIVASGNQFERIRLDFPNDWKELSFVAENGMYLITEGRDMDYEQLDKNLVRDLLDFMDKRPELTPALCGRKYAYIVKGKNQRFINSIKYYCPKHKIIKDFSKLPDDVFFKFTVDVPDKLTKKMVDEINHNFKDRIFATSSGFGNIDLILPKVNKAVGLKKMLAKWNLTLDNLIAFGDGGNDVEMLREAGLSYAMDNASEEAKKVADKIAPNNNESGVLQILEKYLN